jgi:hypothetical protein
VSNIEYVMVMHDGGRATRFMSEDYCKDLMEQLSAAQSTEVCTVPHSDEVMEFCPYCKIEQLTRDLSDARWRITTLEEVIDSRNRALGFVPVEELTPPGEKT